MKTTETQLVRGLILVVLLLVACARGAPGSTSPSSASEADGGVATAAAALTTSPPRLRLKLRGTNLSGGEFGSALPGVYGRDYRYPGPPEVDYFLVRGMNSFRIPFRHERLQRQLRMGLDEGEWTRLLELVSYATDRGATVTLEAHNSARYYGRVVSEVEMGDLWGRVAVRLKTHPAAARIHLNLTNEPRDMATETWVKLANAGLREIRRVGFTGVVQVPGNGWTGAGHWASTWYGTPNTKALLQVVDPGANVAFEAHLYLDDNANGNGDCLSETIGVERVRVFTDWLRANGKVGVLGEIGAIATERCRAAVTRTIRFLEDEAFDVMLGWTWWSAGVWSFATTYPLSIGPVLEDGGAEKPQMVWLKPFLACGAW